VWFTTHFSTHKMDIVFKAASSTKTSISPSQTSAHSDSLLAVIYGVAGGAAIVAAILAVLKLVIRKDEKNKN